MVDLRRRHFLFGAAATAALLAPRTYVIFPRSEGIVVPLSNGPLNICSFEQLDLELRAEVGGVYWRQSWTDTSMVTRVVTEMRVRLFPEQRTALLLEAR